MTERQMETSEKVQIMIKERTSMYSTKITPTTVYGCRTECVGDGKKKKKT